MKLADLFIRRITAELQRHGVKGAKLEAALKQFKRAWIQFSADEEAESAAHWNDAEIVNERTIKVFAPKPRSLRGPIPKLALRNYVQSVVAIFEQATGKQIGRYYYVNTPARKLMIGPQRPNQELPHSFVLACLRVVGITPSGRGHSKYPRGIIKEVLHELHPNAKKGRPKKAQLTTILAKKKRKLV